MATLNVYEFYRTTMAAKAMVLSYQKRIVNSDLAELEL